MVAQKCSGIVNGWVDWNVPDDFALVGTRASVQAQLGNVVPPLLARQVIEQVFGRAYGRLADAHSITGYRLLGTGTIDEDLSALLPDKEQVVSSVLDGINSPRRVSNHGVAGDLVVALARRGLGPG